MPETDFEPIAGRYLHVELEGERHRLYLEAVIPPHCGIRVWLAATESTTKPEPDAWYEHRFGATEREHDGVPRGVWVPAGSELPFHEGLLDCPREPHRAGQILRARSCSRCRTRFCA